MSARRSSRDARLDGYEAHSGLRDLGEGAWILQREKLVGHHIAAMDHLVKRLPLQAEHLRLFGKTYLTPRLTSFHGDAGRAYSYSGRRFEPEPWTAGLLELRERIEGEVGIRFNTVLVNYYRDGDDSMGWHADNEAELGPRRDNILIGSLSLGARRRFLLRHKRTRQTLEIPLGEGDLLVMGGTTQRLWRHRLPRTARPVGPRMNLTFRYVEPS